MRTYLFEHKHSCSVELVVSSPHVIPIPSSALTLFPLLQTLSLRRSQSECSPFRFCLLPLPLAPYLCLSFLRVFVVDFIRPFGSHQWAVSRISYSFIHFAFQPNSPILQLAIILPPNLRNVSDSRDKIANFDSHAVTR